MSDACPVTVSYETLQIRTLDGPVTVTYQVTREAEPTWAESPGHEQDAFTYYREVSRTVVSGPEDFTEVNHAQQQRSLHAAETTAQALMAEARQARAGSVQEQFEQRVTALLLDL